MLTTDARRRWARIVSLQSELKISATKRLLGTGLLAVSLMMAMGVGSAVGKKVRSPREVSMEFTRNLTGTDQFSGVVSSPNPACVRGAVVKLYYRPASEGGGGGQTPTTVATARADASGNWTISYEVTDSPSSDFSTFAAHVDRNHLKSKPGKPQRVCTSGASPTKTILNPQFL